MNLQEEKNSSDYLPKNFCTQAFMAITQEALDQLSIIRKINNWPNPTRNIQEFTYKTIEERYTEEVITPKDNTSNTVEQENTPLHIFQKTCTILESVLIILQNELTSCGTFEQFSTIVDGYIQMEKDDKNLLRTALEKKNELKTLEETFEDERMDFFTKIEKCMSQTGEMKDIIEDFTIEENVKKAFVRAWQKSKMEMNEIVCRMKEDSKSEEIKIINSNVGREMRVHEEIILAYQEIEMDLDETLRQWKERYTADLHAILEKIQDLKKHYDQQLEKIMQLEALYSKREKQMNDYKNYKIEQEKRRQEMERKNLAATKIQAWWRGTMVRRGFGKYKKKKEKKGKKKNSEKKTGKVPT